MTATTSGRPYDAARATDSGVPPTPTQATRPRSVRGNTETPSSGGRIEPSQLTGSSRSSRGEELELLGEQHLVVVEREPEERERLGERAAARGSPRRDRRETASRVANRWKTRIGSSELSTVTDVPSRIREVCPAIAASTTSGALIAKSGRWCSPTPKKSSPTSSARTASATTWRIASGCGSGSPSAAERHVTEGVQAEGRSLRRCPAASMSTTPSSRVR